MARVEGMLVVAGTRDDLRSALDRALDPPPAPDAVTSGWLLRVDPEGLSRSGQLGWRRLGEGLRAAGCRRLDLVATLAGDHLSIRLNDRLDAAPVLGASVDPDWLSWVPAKEVVAACALALDTDREAWNRLFDVADRVEKVDPAMAKAAPLRVRLNVLAGAMGVRPEVDLWPRLRGVSGFLAGSDAGSLDSALLAMHATDEAAAERLASDVVPRLARAFGTNPPDGPVPPGEARLLGRWNGRSLRVIRRGPTVLIGWGDSSLPGALDAHEHPEHSAGRLLRETWGERPVQRAGAVWPGRLPGLDRTSSLSKALAGSPPMVWCGGREGAEVRDEVLWTGLRETIHRLLDELPLEPPKTPTP